MLVQIVEGLENEDFRRIPAPIYGRGFIKLYCEAVGLDPKPLQAEFMDLFNRAKNDPEEVDIPRPVRRDTMPPAPPPVEAPPPEPEAAPQPVPEAIMQPEPVTVPQPAHEEVFQDSPQPPVRQTDAPAAHEPPPVDDLGDLFAAAAQREMQRPPVQSLPSQPPPKRNYEDLFGHAYADENKEPKPSAAEKFRNTMSNVSSGVFANVQKLPRNTGRIVMVAVCAILLVALLCWGVSALYKATSHTEADSARQTQDSVEPAVTVSGRDEVEKKPKAAASKPGKPASAAPAASVKPADLKSSGIEVPALYID
jgi:hypothetical protein